MSIHAAPLFIVVMTLSIASCSSMRKPCATGGQPAREKPAVAKIDKKQCEQTVNKSGKEINHGRYREWYLNGKLALEGEYRDGQKHGKWFEYDEEGKLISERWFADGKEEPTRATGKQSTGASEN